MLPSARRYLLIIALLLAGVALTWSQRWISATKSTAEPLPPPGPATAPEYTYFVDVEGWYRITPYETVVRSPFDLAADTTAAMAAALPSTLGEWQQVGPDEDIGEDPAVVTYLNQPTVALQRTYHDTSGQRLTLTIVGNKGQDSFLLFSHTPETCYPGRLWQVIASRRESALLDDRPMHAQYLLTQHAQTGEKLMVLFWYLWDNPQRDAQDGVLSMRVNLFVPPGQDEEAILARAWDFVRVLFPQTVPWERF
jgi:Protein of unknown function (DUF3485)